MDALTAVNLEQFGAFAMVIVVLIWWIVKAEDRAKRAEDSRDKWQQLAFDEQTKAQQQYYESIKIFDKMVEAARTGRV